MADSPKRVSWDACTWIALIQQEKIRDEKGNVVEDRYALARSVIDLAAQGKIEIAASGLCLAEVCKNPPNAKDGDDKVAPFFEQNYILIVALDTQVGTIARRLMMAKHAGVRPPDAVHLATAIVANVDEMHTFDDKLLALDEKLVKRDGNALKICKPAHGGKPMPLLDAIAKPAPAKPPEVEANAANPAPPAQDPNKPKEGEAPKPANTGPEVPPDGGESPVRPKRGDVPQDAQEALAAHANPGGGDPKQASVTTDPPPSPPPPPTPQPEADKKT